MTKETRPNQFYEIRNPRTGGTHLPPENRVWRFQPSTMQRYIEQGDIIWPGDYPERNMTRPRFKTRYDPENRNPVSTWIDTKSDAENELSILTAGLNEEGTKELREIFGSQVVEYPKPVSLLKSLTALASTDDDLVVDFFAGSGTTAQAVLECNREDGARRRFVMVQFPERTPKDSPARGAGFETIADIGKERIRRVIAEMQEPAGDDGQLALDMGEAPADLGFKVFKLAPSTFQRWEPPAGEEPDDLKEQLVLFEGGLTPDAGPLDVIYEVILKEGYSLNARIEPLDLATNQVYRVTDEAGDKTLKVSETFRVSPPPAFYICLDDEVDAGTLDRLNLDKETMFVCLDTALDDSKKVNLALQCLLKVI